MKKDEILNLIDEMKQAVVREMQKKNYNNALCLISSCAQLLYETNLYYVDQDLENNLKMISKNFYKQECKCCDSNSILFYDGFGLDNRGLAQIYLKALCKIRKVYYITYSDRRESIPNILKILQANDGEALFIKRKMACPIKSIHQLQQMVERIRPKDFFFYSTPDDVVGTTILYAYEGKLTRYQINLTDHAFWLGAQCIDKCIEFRSYGANISSEYRHIARNKIALVPFYPIIDYDRKFDGYPFEIRNNQKVIFSGGALYKTFGKGNKYYQIVDYILKNYEDTIFWYAGFGNCVEMNKIAVKYPNRVYVTSERSDLYEVLKHCYFYLSTYPLCGGLMFQYSVKAGKVPITLRDSEVTDGFLIDQDNLGIQFDSMDDLNREIDHMMNDECYTHEKGEKLKSSVISEKDFNDEIEKLLNDQVSKYEISYVHIDSSEFQQTYMDNLTNKSINQILARGDNMVLLRYEPIRFLMGWYLRIKNKVQHTLVNRN